MEGQSDVCGKARTRCAGLGVQVRHRVRSVDEELFRGQRVCIRQGDNQSLEEI